ncbi:MAG: hypothetical protein ABI211_17550 [Vicinamibacterales bacterium]
MHGPQRVRTAFIVALLPEQEPTARGTVTFYRASDASADRVMPSVAAAATPVLPCSSLVSRTNSAAP